MIRSWSPTAVLSRTSAAYFCKLGTRDSSTTGSKRCEPEKVTRTKENEIPRLSPETLDIISGHRITILSEEMPRVDCKDEFNSDFEIDFPNSNTTALQSRVHSARLVSLPRPLNLKYWVSDIHTMLCRNQNCSISLCQHSDKFPELNQSIRTAWFRKQQNDPVFWYSWVLTRWSWHSISVQHCVDVR